MTTVPRLPPITKLLIAVLTALCIGNVACLTGKELDPQPLTAPYAFKELLSRAEELFRQNNYREALIFFYEALDAVKSNEVKAKIHFRMAESLEGIRRFEFAEYHYKKAIRMALPENLSARALLKLKHLPKLAQHTEAVRLFEKAMKAFAKRDIRASIDDYLRAVQLEPALMAKDESGLIDDAIKYLTFLSESKDKEPYRLLKLATFLELKGDTEKALETLKQILIIYPNFKMADEIEEKISFYEGKRNLYLEPVRTHDAIAQVVPAQDQEIFADSFDFTDPGVISRDLQECAFTFRALNEQTNVPRNRFEQFLVTLGQGAEQQELLFSAVEGIAEKTLLHESGDVLYTLTFEEVNQTVAYIQDIYGEGTRAAPFFTKIRVHLLVSRK